MESVIQQNHGSQIMLQNCDPDHGSPGISHDPNHDSDHKWSGSSEPCSLLTLHTFSAQFRGEMGKEHRFFEAKKGGKPHIIHPNWLRGFLFGYVIQYLIFYQLAKKGEKFLFLTPQHFHSQIGAELNFDPSSSLLIYIYSAAKRRRSTELDRFWFVPSRVNEFNVWGKKIKN